MIAVPPLTHRNFSDLIAAIVNWRDRPAIIQREPGVCVCGQDIVHHDDRIHVARRTERLEKAGTDER